MDRMPPELHHQVCEYLSLADLKNCRLVNKQLKAISAVKLYRQLTFHASFASVGRIHAVAAHPLLRQHVQSLVWDANMWAPASDISSLRRFRRHVEKPVLPWDPPRGERIEQWLAEQLNIDPAEKAKYQTELDFETDRQYVQYRENIAEEYTVTKKRLIASYLSPILARLCQLSEIKIVNGKFSILDGDIIKSNLNDSYYGGEVLSRKGNALLARGEGVWKEDLPTGLPAQHAFETSLLLDSCKIKVLEVNHMHWKTFEPSISFKACDNRGSSLFDTLTTLSMTLVTYSEHPEDSEDLDEIDIRQCRRAMKSGTLKLFIQGLQNLRDLRILMPYESEEYCGAVNLSDVVPINQTKLRKLSLEHFETSERDILRLLISNCNLRNLSLRDMYLVPQGSWVRVFNAVREAIRIESATFGGYMCDSVCEDDHVFLYDTGIEDGWNFDKGNPALSAALEKYLIHGEACPLHHNDKMAVKEGLLDPIVSVSD